MSASSAAPPGASDPAPATAAPPVADEAAAPPGSVEEDWKPRFNPWIVAWAVMLGTFMEVLDTTVANVALPHIAGSMSATNSEATWVLTSYLVANAIILPAADWFGKFFGRKNFYVACLALFTISSALCGAASSMGFLILARIFQGIGGGAMQPISQAVLLESFPPAKRGQAMAVWALGVVTAPVIGPTLGGWLTDHYSWSWIFWINIPVGLLAILLGVVFVEDPPYARRQAPGSIDYVGFSFMALWLATLQIFLDKGQEEDWFHSEFITGLAITSVVSMLLFVIWELRVKNPVVDLRVMRNRNFAVGTFLIVVAGAVLYATTSLIPMYLQTLMGYSAYMSGIAVSPRGLGSMVSMIVVGILVGCVDGRLLLAIGFACLAYSMHWLGGIYLGIDLGGMIWPNVLNGVSLGLIFLPITTLATASIPKAQLGNATGLYNLARNIGGSIGISLTTTMLARGAQAHQAHMVGHMSPFDPAYSQMLATIQQGLSVPLGHAAEKAGLHLAYSILLQQSTLWAFIDNFRWMALLSLACIPLIFLFKSVKPSRDAGAMH